MRGIDEGARRAEDHAKHGSAFRGLDLVGANSKLNVHDPWPDCLMGSQFSSSRSFDKRCVLPLLVASAIK